MDDFKLSTSLWSCTDIRLATVFITVFVFANSILFVGLLFSFTFSFSVLLCYISLIFSPPTKSVKAWEHLLYYSKAFGRHCRSLSRTFSSTRHAKYELHSSFHTQLYCVNQIQMSLLVAMMNFCMSMRFNKQMMNTLWWERGLRLSVLARKKRELENPRDLLIFQELLAEIAVLFTMFSSFPVYVACLQPFQHWAPHFLCCRSTAFVSSILHSRILSKFPLVLEM